MVSVHLTITTQEAATIVAALGFIRENLALKEDDLLFHFVPGRPLALGIGEAAALDDLFVRINDAAADAIERHPFSPYVSVF